jgi:hypothetical protein
MAKILFTEVQGFRNNLLWAAALLIPAIASLSIFAYQVITGDMLSDAPMSNLSLGIFSFGYLTLVAFIFPYVRLTTIIDEEKISYGWNVPTKDLNEIPIADIKEWSIIKYRFVGYGYKISRLYGVVYNVSGNRGLQIITRTGEKILIGTIHIRALKEVIEKIKLA